jgi:hypothetical protein
MQLSSIRAEIEHMRRQIHRQRKEIRDLQRAGIPTGSAEQLLARMLSKVDELVSSATGRLARNGESIPAQTKLSTGQSSGVSDEVSLVRRER